MGGRGPWGCALGQKPSGFVLGWDDDEAYSPGCSWQKPYFTHQREKIDKHLRPVVSSNYLIRTLLSAWAAEMGNPGQRTEGCHAGLVGPTPASRVACAAMKLQDLKSRIVAALDYVNGVDRRNGRSGYLLAGDVDLMRSAMAR